MKIAHNPAVSIKTLLISLILCFALNISAKHLPVKIYTSADGLGSSFVDWIFRDSRDFMWFCTRDGLSRFDGSQFVTYQISEENSPPGIEAFYETRDGYYWVSTTGGMFRFSGEQISHLDEFAPLINAEFIPNARGSLLEDSRGDLWLSSGSGIQQLNKNSEEIEFSEVDWTLPPQYKKGFASYQILEANDGSIWVNSSWGVIRRLPDNRIVFYEDENIFSGGVGSASMITDKIGRIWLTRSNQIWVIKPEAIEALPPTEQLVIKPLRATSKIKLAAEQNVLMPKAGGEIFRYTNSDLIEKSAGTRICQTSDGTIWISAESNLLEFANDGLRIHNSDEGLPDAMGQLAEDAAGNLWVAGYAGLARLDRHGMISYNLADGANSSRFFSVNQAIDGTLYFANGDSYISYFDQTKFKNIHPGFDQSPKHLWTSRHVFQSSDGDWWFLSDGKLYRFSGVSNISQLDGRMPTKIYTTKDGFETDGFYQIFEDSSGSIWVSTRGLKSNAYSLSRLKKGEEKFYIFGQKEEFPVKKSPSAFAEDNNGVLWLAFYEGGLARFDGERFELFSENLPKALLSDLLVDKKGRLWIGSTLGGLIRLDDPGAKTPLFSILTTRDGLTSNNVRTLTEDHFGRIYVGTARGVDRLSPDTGRIKHYSVSDGLAADFIVDSHCDKDGNLWFVTNSGVSRLTPLPDEKSFPPQIFIGGVKFSGVKQGVSDLGSKQIERGDLSYKENNLQVEFFGLEFRAGETLRYQYKLEGSNADWSIPSEQRSVTFANLSPGSYRFLVRAINSDGIASENPAALSFRILPPIWQRWWFIALCVLIVAAFAWAFYRYRLARLREVNFALTEAKLAEENLRKSKEDRLAELEKVRSRIATDLHDDIGSSLTQIAVLSEVAQAQNKDNGTSEPLRKISSVSNELVETMSDIVWSINPTKDHLSDLTQRMRRFASDVLSSKGIVFQFAVAEKDENTIVNTNTRREVFLIFKESINNIVKYSEARHVKIELDVSSEKLILKISDNGKGFNSTLLDSRNDSSANSKTRGGNGLISMRKRAKEMNGYLDIESTENSGTTIFLQLPLEQHLTI